MTDETSNAAARGGGTAAPKAETVPLTEDEAERAAALRARIVALARAQGITGFSAAYNGGGDSGMLEAPEMLTTGDKAFLAALPVPVVQRAYCIESRGYRLCLKPLPLLAAVEELLADLLTANVGDWWNGDIESHGEITWHIGVDTDHIEGDHNMAYRQYDSSAWEA